MRYAVSPLPDETDGRAEVGDDSGTTTVRFGDVLFHLTEKSRWGGQAKTAVAAGARLERLPHATPRERLHLVVQKGRLFQQEHPQVPVLLDKGRYLVVDLDPRDAKLWHCGDRPCFAIRPLPEGGVAFDLRVPPADRGSPVPWVQSLVDGLGR